MKQLLSTNLGQLNYANHLEWKVAIAEESKNAETMAWTGKYPPSRVLGPIMGQMSSGVLSLLSLTFFFGAAMAGKALYDLPGPWGTAENDKLIPLFLLGLQLFPISWGVHVAAWVQKSNGK